MFPAGAGNPCPELAEGGAQPTRDVVPLLGLCAGVAAAPGDPPRPRLLLETVSHENRFELDPGRQGDLVAGHDRELASSGFYAGRRIGYAEVAGTGDDPTPQSRYGWSEHVARKQARTWWLSAGTKRRSDLATLGLGLAD